MTRRALMTVLAAALMAGSACAITGPANGGYIWMTKLQTMSAGGVNCYIDPVLMVLKVDNCMVGDPAGFQVFSPAIPDRYIISGHPSNQHGPGERCGLPTILEPSTTDGYGKLLLGAYVDNVPLATTQGTTPPSQTMDILRLEPQAGGALNYYSVYPGKADVSGQFHTEDATQVLYDRGGLWTTVAKSALVTGETRQMTNRTDGYLTDVDGNGAFDDAGDTETYVNLATLNGKKVMYENYLYGDGSYITFGGKNYGSAKLLMQHKRLDNGSLASTVYYHDCATLPDAGSLTLQLSGITTGPVLAVGDPNRNGIPDIYVSLYRINYDFNGDCTISSTEYTYGIGHMEDANQDGDALDPGEHQVFTMVGRQNGPAAPWDPLNQIWWTNGAPTPFAVVESDNGEFSLLCQMTGYWKWNRTLFALGIGDNALFDGTYSIIATQAHQAADTWPYFADLGGFNYALWDPIQSSAIPEPGTLLLLGTGALAALGYIRRRRMA